MWTLWTLWTPWTEDKTVEPIAISAGSGIILEALLDRVEKEVPFGDIPGLGAGDVAGHRYVFVHGHCGEIPVIVQSGRVHFYEGMDFGGVTRTVEVLHGYGVRTVVFVNAAGGLDPAVSRGEVVGVDRVRLCRYAGWDATPGVLFPDFTVPGCDWTGTLHWIHGPSYETRAEIVALQGMKSMAVGMSTAPELARCQELGMRGAVVSCVTNCCWKPGALTHAEVTDTARRASARIASILRQALPGIAAAC